MGEDAPSVSILRRIGKQFPKDGPSRFIAVYLGVGFIVAFLFLASLGPQLGQKFGNLSTRKAQQESQAALLNTGPFRIVASAYTVKAGQTVTLTWDAQAYGYTNECAISGASDFSGKVPPKSQKTVTVNSPTTYTLSCTKYQGGTSPWRTDVAQTRIKAINSLSDQGSCRIVGGSPYYYGDMDNNGILERADADIILRIVAKIPPYNAPSQTQIDQADVDDTPFTTSTVADVTSIDALMVLRTLDPNQPNYLPKLPACAYTMPPPPSWAPTTAPSTTSTTTPQTVAPPTNLRAISGCTNGRSSVSFSWTSPTGIFPQGYAIEINISTDITFSTTGRRSLVRTNTYNWTSSNFVFGDSDHLLAGSQTIPQGSKTYYVRARTGAVINGVTLYSIWTSGNLAVTSSCQ